MNLYKQVKGFIPRNYIVSQFKHYLHNDNVSKNKVLYPLSRGLLKVVGEDTSGFLQGLITNDMRHFDTGAQSIYAMFLNNKGRVLYDTLIHKWDTTESFLIECDLKLLHLLSKHLKMFKLRRNIRIEDVSKDFNLWILTLSTVPDTKTNDAIKIYKDPRLTDLGLRIIASNTLKGAQIADHFGKGVCVEDNDDGYKYLRYKLGVSEGADDLVPAANFPLEANCDYLHGVSFHKGCYIGQEVTARVHHTGVVRKRIMPLKFLEPPQALLEQSDPNIVSAKSPNTNLGKIKGIIKDYGIGLIRIKEALEAKTVKVNNCTAEPYKPMWWPREAPKEITKVKESV